MVSVIPTCVVAACLSALVFLVVLNKSIPGDEGESCEATPAVPAVLQNVPFPSKLATKRNMTSNWKRFSRVWSNYEIASHFVKLTCLVFVSPS